MTATMRGRIIEAARVIGEASSARTAGDALHLTMQPRLAGMHCGLPRRRL